MADTETLTPAALELRLVPHRLDRVVRDGIDWAAGGGMVSISFLVKGRDALRDQARQAAFDESFLEPIRARLLQSPEGGRLVKLRGKLQAAEKSLGEVRRQRSRLGLDRESLLDQESGEALTVRLGELEAQDAVLAQRQEASRVGLEQLRQQVESLRSLMRSSFSSWVQDSAHQKRQEALRRAEEIREHLGERPLAEALAELVAAEAEAAFLSMDKLAWDRASHLLAEMDLE
jgi:hypothetical protein